MSPNLSKGRGALRSRTVLGTLLVGSAALFVFPSRSCALDVTVTAPVTPIIIAWDGQPHTVTYDYSVSGEPKPTTECGVKPTVLTWSGTDGPDKGYTTVQNPGIYQITVQASATCSRDPQNGAKPSDCPSVSSLPSAPVSVEIRVIKLQVQAYPFADVSLAGAETGFFVTKLVAEPAGLNTTYNWSGVVSGHDYSETYTPTVPTSGNAAAVAVNYGGVVQYTGATQDICQFIFDIEPTGAGNLLGYSIQLLGTGETAEYSFIDDWVSEAGPFSVMYSDNHDIGLPDHDPDITATSLPPEPYGEPEYSMNSSSSGIATYALNPYAACDVSGELAVDPPPKDPAAKGAAPQTVTVPTPLDAAQQYIDKINDEYKKLVATTGFTAGPPAAGPALFWIRDNVAGVDMYNQKTDGTDKNVACTLTWGTTLGESVNLVIANMGTRHVVYQAKASMDSYLWMGKNHRTGVLYTHPIYNCVSLLLKNKWVNTSPWQTAMATSDWGPFDLEPNSDLRFPSATGWFSLGDMGPNYTGTPKPQYTINGNF